MKGPQERSPLFFHRLTLAYLACMVSVFLLYVGGDYQQITERKALLYGLLSGAYLLVYLVGRVELALVGALRLPTPAALWNTMNLTQKLILVFWLLAVLSTIFSVDPATSLWGSPRRDGLITLTLYCGCFLLVSGNGRPGAWLLGLFGGTISLHCVLALIQLMGFNPLNLYPQGMTYYDGGRLYAGQFLGTIGNVDLVSAVLCIAVPAFWIALLKGRGNLRFLLLIPLVLSLTVLFWSFVAGGVVGVCGSLLLTIPVLPREARPRRCLAVVVAVVLLVGLAAVYVLGDSLPGFLYEASELLHGRWEDSYGSGRIYIWRETVKLVPDRLLLGGGPDTLGLRTDAVFERYDENLGMMIRSVVDTAHNEYLNILVNQGLLALLVYLTALGAAAWTWIKAAPENSTAAVCGGAVLGYSIQAFFGISSPISAPYFWLALALLLGSVDHAYRSKENWREKHDKRKT